MDKTYQVIGQLSDGFTEVLETCSNREEAEYALANFLLYPVSKYYNFHILEIGKDSYAGSEK